MECYFCIIDTFEAYSKHIRYLEMRNTMERFFWEIISGEKSELFDHTVLHIHAKFYFPFLGEIKSRFRTNSLVQTGSSFLTSWGRGIRWKFRLKSPWQKSVLKANMLVKFFGVRETLDLCYIWRVTNKKSTFRQKHFSGLI